MHGGRGAHEICFQGPQMIVVPRRLMELVTRSNQGGESQKQEPTNGNSMMPANINVYMCVATATLRPMNTAANAPMSVGAYALHK